MTLCVDIEQKIKRALPHIKVLNIHSDNSERFIITKDINKYILDNKINLVIFSPTITVGVDITTKFNKVFGLVSTFSCNPRDFIQMLHRFRNVVDNTVHVYNNGHAKNVDIAMWSYKQVLALNKKYEQYNYILSVSGIYKKPKNNEPDSFYKLCVFNDVEKLNSTNYFLSSLYYLVINKGYDFIISNEKTGNPKRLERSIKETKITKIIEADCKLISFEPDSHKMFLNEGINDKVIIEKDEYKNLLVRQFLPEIYNAADKSDVNNFYKEVETITASKTIQEEFDTCTIATDAPDETQGSSSSSSSGINDIALSSQEHASEGGYDPKEFLDEQALQADLDFELSQQELHLQEEELIDELDIADNDKNNNDDKEAPIDCDGEPPIDYCDKEAPIDYCNDEPIDCDEPPIDYCDDEPLDYCNDEPPINLQCEPTNSAEKDKKKYYFKDIDITEQDPYEERKEKVKTILSKMDDYVPLQTDSKNLYLCDDYKKELNVDKLTKQDLNAVFGQKYLIYNLYDLIHGGIVTSKVNKKNTDYNDKVYNISLIEMILNYFNFNVKTVDITQNSHKLDIDAKKIISIYNKIINHEIFDVNQIKRVYNGALKKYSTARIQNMSTSKQILGFINAILKPFSIAIRYHNDAKKAGKDSYSLEFLLSMNRIVYRKLYKDLLPFEVNVNGRSRAEVSCNIFPKYNNNIIEDEQ
jgi:hypothetical protein